MPVLIAIVVFVFGYWIYENWAKIEKSAYYWTKLQSAPSCENIDEIAKFCGGELGFVLRDGTKSTFVNPYTSEAVTITSSSAGDFCDVEDASLFEQWKAIFQHMAQRDGIEGQEVQIHQLFRSGRILAGRASWTTAELVEGRNGQVNAVLGAHCDGYAYSFAHVRLDPDYFLFPSVGLRQLLSAFSPPEKLAEAFKP